MNDKCLQPHWKVINGLCKNKIEKKFPEHGNSWKLEFSIGFWNQRLQCEVDEVKDEYNDKRVDELVDVINVCAMEISNRLDSKQRETVMMRLGF